MRKNLSQEKNQNDIVKKMNQNNDMKKIVIDKIRIQWKTISKAFKDIGRSKDYILKADLKFYLDHWGLQLDDSQVQDIFRMLDQDQDGKISF